MIHSSRWRWCRYCPHNTETSHHKILRQIRCPNMAIVFTMPMHLKVQVQSIIGSLHQIFPASLNSSPRVYSCVLITWREWPSQRRRRNKQFQCQTNVGIFSSSNKLYQTQVESRIRCRTDQYTTITGQHWSMTSSWCPKWQVRRLIEYCDTGWSHPRFFPQ